MCRKIIHELTLIFFLCNSLNWLLFRYFFFRYHPINAAQAKKNYDEYISDYYYDYDYKEISSPTKDIVVVEEENGSAKR